MKTVLSWSTGKDSAWALYQLQKDNAYDLAALATTFNSQADRVAMHAVRRELARRQAAAAGLPLWETEIPHRCSNEIYQEKMQSLFSRCHEEGVEALAFGDLFLEDVRDFRLKLLEGTGLKALFPIWGIPTDELATRMKEGGLKAWITCVDPKRLDPQYAGKAWENSILSNKPEGVDLCGENGEFHTFTWDGPMFRQPVLCRPGEVVERDGFVFSDLVI